MCILRLFPILFNMLYTWNVFPRGNRDSSEFYAEVVMKINGSWWEKRGRLHRTSHVLFSSSCFSASDVSIHAHTHQCLLAVTHTGSSLWNILWIELNDSVREKFYGLIFHGKFIQIILWWKEFSLLFSQSVLLQQTSPTVNPSSHPCWGCSPCRKWDAVWQAQE